MNLAYHYPTIYWNTACLIVDAGADEDVEENKSTDYGKIATAISSIQKAGSNIALPLINSANFGFIPDEKNNRIIYSLKAINGLGDDVVRLLIENRPYASMDDFYERMVDTKLIKNSQMVQLIKAGCFTELDNPDRRVTMKDFLIKYVVTPVNKMTLAQFNRLIEFDKKYKCIPEDIRDAIREKFFKDYVLSEYFLYKIYIDEKKKVPQKGYHDRWYKLDDSAMQYFKLHYTEDSVVALDGERFIVSEKKFIKESNKKIQPLKDWLASEETVKIYNDCLFKTAWEKYASGTLSKWEMDSLSIYCNTEHELAKTNLALYDVVDFFSLPEIPRAYKTYSRLITQTVNGVQEKVKKDFPKYEITRIAGTVLDKNKDRHTVSLLTTTGVVTVKFSKGEFVHYDRKLTLDDEDGGTVTENSWLARGNKILVCGYRNENQFRAAKYSDTVWKHTCYLITGINEDGTLNVYTERQSVSEEA